MWWKRSLFWMLMPLAAPQGLAARRRAPRFAPASGPKTGRAGDAESGPLRLLAIGDSIIEGVGCSTLEEAFAGQFAAHLALATGSCVDWQALGKTGACAAEIAAALLPQVQDRSLDIIVISVGVNDVSGLKRSAGFRRDVAALLDGLRERAPNALIVLCGMPQMQRFPLLPQPLRWLAGLRAQTFDAISAQLASERPGAHHEPTAYHPAPHEFAADGYHPNAATQGLWAAELVRRLQGQGHFVAFARGPRSTVAN